MGSRETAEQFERRLWFRPISHAVEINEDGLVLGAGTVLARMNRDPSGAQVLAFDEDRPRLSALLAAAYCRSPPSDLPTHLESAARFWKSGDKALANIRLAFARLPRLDDRAGAYRLFLAERLLDEGLSPDALVKVMGIETAPSDLTKYNPDQPRVPAGSGQNSGQWTSGETAPDESGPKARAGRAASVGIAPAVPAAGTLAEGLFGSAAGAEFLVALGALALQIGTGAVLGAVIVWPGKSVVTQGPVPGNSDLRYSLNNDEGSLRFVRQTESGSETVAVTHQGRDGIYFELETGTPVARAIGGSLVFDAAALADVADEVPARSDAETDASAQRRTEQPQLCPDPSPDVPHGALDRAVAYQAQISALNNPQRPLPPGLAVSLINPDTGKLVAFDDCRESDGTMIEAKGPGYAEMMRSNPFFKDVFSTDWRKQAARQVAASGGRDVEWFFAKPEAAQLAQEVFFNSPRLGGIKVVNVPPIAP